jgi:hypothetical protein
MVLQQRRELLRRLQRLSDQRRPVVVVITKQPNQLYSAVGPVEGQGITRERIKRIQRDLLNQIQVQCTLALC